MPEYIVQSVDAVLAVVCLFKWSFQVVFSGFIFILGSFRHIAGNPTSIPIRGHCSPDIWSNILKKKTLIVLPSNSDLGSRYAAMRRSTWTFSESNVRSLIFQTRFVSQSSVVSRTAPKYVLTLFSEPPMWTFLTLVFFSNSDLEFLNPRSKGPIILSSSVWIMYFGNRKKIHHFLIVLQTFCAKNGLCFA